MAASDYIRNSVDVGKAAMMSAAATKLLGGIGDAPAAQSATMSATSSQSKAAGAFRTRSSRCR